MAAVIAREGHWRSAQGRRMARWRARRSQAGQQQRSQQEVAATHIGYCAPANTCAAGRRVAWRAAKRLASIPATSVASAIGNT